jgi:alpha-tubulin suppressor-like RCC1 family protein
MFLKINSIRIERDDFVSLDSSDDAYSDRNETESKRFEFIQCEAGFGHSLLLNSLGEVYAFGEGLQGQLGIGTKCLHLKKPTQLDFTCNMKEKHII